MDGKGRTPLCFQEVGAIKTMIEKKNSNGTIATALGISETEVSYQVVSARRGAATVRQVKRGLQKLLSPPKLRGLRRIVDDNPFASTAKIA